VPTPHYVRFQPTILLAEQCIVSDAFLSLYQPKLTLRRVLRKFGKQIQKRQLEVPEYAASFVNYKALKKVRRSELPL
jgi:hypothetical protein